MITVVFQTSHAQVIDDVAIGVLGKDVNGTYDVGLVYVYDTEGTLLRIINNPDGNISGQFGQTIAYVDGKIVISAPWLQTKDNKNVGSLYVFDGSDASPLFTIKNPASIGPVEFGWSLVSDDDKIIASAPVYEDNNVRGVGVVYVFDANSGNLIQTINNPDPRFIDSFGNFVLYSNGKILIGTPGKDIGTADTAGAVSVYDFDGGSFLSTIYNPELNSSTQFGNAIAVVNDKLIVGATYKEVNNKHGAGAVYVFDLSTGLLLKTINNPDPDDAVFFGKRIVSVGNNFAVTAPDAGLYKSGKVYVFNGDTGSLIKTLDSPQKNFRTGIGNSNEFGDAMAYKDGHLIIGDRAKIINGVLNAGGVYVYDVSTWNLLQTIDNPDPIENDSFGNYISFVGNVEPLQYETVKKQELAQIPANSYTFDYYSGSLKFDTELGKLSCGEYDNPKTFTSRSLDIDGMDDYFFIIIGKTNFGDYHYLQIKIPDKNSSKNTSSYLLDFRNETAKVRGEFYQGYDKMAIYLETDKSHHAINPDNYKRFLVGQSKSVSPSSESFGPGKYNLHAVLFQSDRTYWINDEVCAISLNWPVSVDSNGNITTDEPQIQSGKIYPIKTNQDALAETDKIIEDSHHENYFVQLEESLHMNSNTVRKHTPTTYLSPIKQIESGISFEEITCQDEHVLIQKYDGSPACVHEKSILKLVQREWGMSENWVKVSNTNNVLHYNLNDANITNILAFSEYKNPSLPGETKQTWLQINLESTQDGSLQITLPRNLIDSKINDDVDDDFFVLLDGTETEYQETKTDSERILNFSIPSKTNVVKILGYGYYNSKLSALSNQIPPEPVINENGTGSENKKPYTWYDIKGIKQIYKIGEPISFTETIQGYDNPCISPYYEILDGNTLESVWEYKIVYPCPFIKEPQQFITIKTVPNENIASPILNHTGPYILRSYHSYDDGYTVVQFSVVDDSFVSILEGSSNSMSQVQLDPKTITVVLGINNTVTWINEDSISHALVSNENSTWQTGIILPGKESTVIFNQTGSFEYHGEPHPWITGKVIVLENEN